MDQFANTVYDVAVIGAGPAGTQAAVSAAHQMRHVIVFDAGAVSQRKGRSYWSKSVEFQDAPVFAGITGPKFVRELHDWLRAYPVSVQPSGRGAGPVGIELHPGLVMDVQRQGEQFALEASTGNLGKGGMPERRRFLARTVVVAAGFEDRWPDIEVQAQAQRMMQRYRTVFRYAGNSKGWHVCIRCDGHLHRGEHLAIVGVGDYIYEAALGAQDFTDRITILTNGRPHGMTPKVLAQVRERDIELVEERISAHIGGGTDLIGLRLADGSVRHFDGFLVDEGLDANTAFLARFSVGTDGEGLLRVNGDAQVLDAGGQPIAGLYAAGDVVSGTRKLIAAALGGGQEAGLSASDSLRRWHWPG